MHRIDGAGHLNNRFVTEDPGTNRPPTEFTEAWFNAVQEEIASLIEWAGLDLAKSDNTQLRQALLAKFAGVQSGVPTGGVVFVSTSSAPSGYLKANGAAVSRSVYEALFDKIGTTFGDGDGDTTFNLPDLRGEFLRGWDNGRGVDAGREVGSRQADMFKSHKHRFINEYNTEMARSVGFSDQNSEGIEPLFTAGNRAYTYVYMDTEGGAETRPRNVALLACIKY